jgi:hypothetical protein
MSKQPTIEEERIPEIGPHAGLLRLTAIAARFEVGRARRE